jgi:hypothetical protein
MYVACSALYMCLLFYHDMPLAWIYLRGSQFVLSSSLINPSLDTFCIVAYYLDCILLFFFIFPFKS